MINLLSLSGVLSTVWSIFLAILMLLIMISIHELGHYIAGKIFKFKINEFAIGMGPAVYKRKSKKTGEVFSVRALPLGGFCSFEGEDENSEDKGAFNNKEPWKRIIVLVAGATMNLVLGIIILTLSVGIYGQLCVCAYDVKPISDAEYVGYTLQDEDVILEVDGKNVFLANDLMEKLDGKKKGEVVTVKVLANGEVVERKVRLRNDVTVANLTDPYRAFTALGIATIQEVSGGELDGCYLLSYKDNLSGERKQIYYVEELASYAKTLSVNETLTFYYLNQDGERLEKSVVLTEDLSLKSNGEILQYLGISETSTLLKYANENVKFSFFETIERGFQYSFSIGGTIFRTLGELLTGKLSIRAMGGTVTTVKLTAEAIKFGGFNYFLEMAGFIGVNLAVFNLLPIPALDGSRAVFCVIEWIRKKPLNRKVEGVIHAVGLVLLLGFSILVDLLQLF